MHAVSLTAVALAALQSHDVVPSIAVDVETYRACVGLRPGRQKSVDFNNSQSLIPHI